MKKLLLIVVSLLSILKGKSQVTFCPVGAEWSYEFSNIIFSPSVSNHKINCTGSYVDGIDTIKTLVHSKFYLYCNDFSPFNTLIKQRGDTVFFSNSKTQNSWQILYNFAAQVGQGWQTTILQKNGNPITLAYLVDSVKTISINGLNLRRLYINNGSTVVTERFGNSGLLFNFPNSGLGWCDGDYFHEFLCYSDPEFGTKQFSAKPCDFSNLTEIINLKDSESLIQVYPNPTSDIINFIFENYPKINNYEVCIINILGEKLSTPRTLSNVANSIQIDLSTFNSGIYFLRVVQNKKIIMNKKIIKE